MAEVRYEGVDLLGRNLRKIHSDLPKGLKRIHRQLADPIAVAARRKARKKSGRMAGTIRPRSTAAMAILEAGPLHYLPVQHWGWPGHNIEPNRFITDALEERTPEIFRLYETKLGEWVDSVWIDS